MLVRSRWVNEPTTTTSSRTCSRSSTSSARIALRRPRSSWMRQAAGPSARSQARTEADKEEAQLMKSRLVILTMLVLGMLLSTTGAGLAVTGLSGRQRERRPVRDADPTPTGGGGVLGDQDTGSGTAPEPSNGGGTRRRGRQHAARPSGRGGRQQQQAPVHRLRGDPGPARRHRAAERGPRAPPPHRRRALSATASDSPRGGLRPASRR